MSTLAGSRDQRDLSHTPERSLVSPVRRKVRPCLMRPRTLLIRGKLGCRLRRTIDILRSQFPGTWTYHAPGTWERKEGGMAWWSTTLSGDDDTPGWSTLHFYPGDGAAPILVVG